MVAMTPKIPNTGWILHKRIDTSTNIAKVKYPIVEIAFMMAFIVVLMLL